MIAIVGWLLLVTIVAILFEDEEPSLFEGGDDAAEAEQPDPLETLRGRYARGELSDEAFEHRAERLLETEDVEMLEPPTRTTSAVDVDLDLERER